MDFVLLHARGPEHHACSANMTGLATPLRMAAGKLESGHGTGAAAWKRAEQQVELHSDAGAVARVGLHDAVPAGAAQIGLVDKRAGQRRWGGGRVGLTLNT